MTIFKTTLFFFLIFLNTKLTSMNKIGFLFAPGFCGTRDQIKLYNFQNYNGWEIIEKTSPSFSFNFSEINVDNSINIRNANFAQEDDLKLLKDAYQNFCSIYNLDKVVIIGVSRGAAAAINFAATKPDKLAALILEAPFDCIENVIKYQLDRRYIGWIPGCHSLTWWIINKFLYPKYNTNGLKPINEITKINRDLPIIIIHSKEDELICIKSSQNLFQKLKHRNFKHAYFLELSSGNHVRYQFKNDAYIYQAVIHAFYAKYDIPHDKQLAQVGQRLLKKS